MESLSLKNPDDILKKLNELSDAMAKARYNYNLLDGMTKVIFAKLCLEAKQKYNCSMAEASNHAYINAEYKKHIKGLAAASSEYDRLKANFNNYTSYVEYLRSYLSCQKHLN